MVCSHCLFAQLYKKTCHFDLKYNTGEFLVTPCYHVLLDLCTISQDFRGKKYKVRRVDLQCLSVTAELIKYDRATSSHWTIYVLVLQQLIRKRLLEVSECLSMQHQQAVFETELEAPPVTRGQL